MAKQITLKRIIELGGLVDNNHLANVVINNLDAKVRMAESMGFEASARAYRERWRDLYDELDRLGYWEEVQ